MIDREVQNLFDKVYHDLYTGDTFELSFDANFFVWLRFKLQIESMISGIDIRTLQFLQQYIDKAEREMMEIKVNKNRCLADPIAKMLWEQLFKKSSN